MFADAYGMTARQCADLAPLTAALARRYHENSRTRARRDPVFRRHSDDGGKDVLAHAEARVREMAPEIAARLSQPG